MPTHGENCAILVSLPCLFGLAHRATVRAWKTGGQSTLLTHGHADQRGSRASGSRGWLIRQSATRNCTLTDFTDTRGASGTPHDVQRLAAAALSHARPSPFSSCADLIRASRPPRDGAEPLGIARFRRAPHPSSGSPRAAGAAFPVVFPSLPVIIGWTLRVSIMSRPTKSEIERLLLAGTSVPWVDATGKSFRLQLTDPVNSDVCWPSSSRRVSASPWGCLTVSSPASLTHSTQAMTQR